MIVAVVGTGRMAPGVATAFSQAGLQVRVVGRSLPKAASVAEEVGGSTEGLPLEPSSFSGVELAVETVTEDPTTKADILARVESWLSADAVLATNTSGMRITDLAAPLQRPASFAGLHFLFPADATAVVEVVAGQRTSPLTIDRLSEVVRAMGKQPIVVARDEPGFVWNRLQLALLREALHMLESGIASVDAIDAAVSDGLAPRWISGGPFATVDLGGIETWTRVAAEVFPHLATDATVSPVLSERASRTGAFYDWDVTDRAAVLDLRRRALERIRDITDERRRVTPELEEGHS